MPNPIVIDISHWQSEPDFAKVKKGGTVGVILKATEGTKYEDPTFAKRTTAARKAGLLTSSYHFLKHGNIQAQMDWYLKVVEPTPTERVVIDYEDPDCTLDDLTSAVRYLLERGVKNITVYAGHLLKQQVGSKVTNDWLKNYTSLWIAHYTSGQPVWPKQIWLYYSLHQYTDKAEVSGIPGNVDGNKWNGVPTQLPGWFDSALIKNPELDDDDVPVTPPVKPVKEMTINIDTPDDIHVTVRLNGLVI